MHHEAVFVLASQRVDALCIALGAQRGHHQRLGFTTREQAETEPWARGSTAVADFDGAHGAGVAAVDAGSPARIWLRTMPASMSNSMPSTLTASNSTPSAFRPAITAA